MEKEQGAIIQACSVPGGLTCINGSREDFKNHPLTGEKLKCHKWIKLVGKDPQTGGDIDTWCCNEFAKIKLALESAQMVRQNTASTDKVANQVAQHRAEFIGALPEEAIVRLLESAPRVTGEPLPAVTLQKEEGDGPRA